MDKNVTNRTLHAHVFFAALFTRRSNPPHPVSLPVLPVPVHDLRASIFITMMDRSQKSEELIEKWDETVSVSTVGLKPRHVKTRQEGGG